MRGRVVRKIAGVVGVGVIAWGLVACGGSGAGQPKAGAATSVSTTPGGSSASASAGAASNPASDGGGSFELPAENRNLKPPVFEDYPGITENTEQGAEQATKFFFDAMYYGYATGDNTPLKQVSNTNACKTCKIVIVEIGANVDAEKYSNVLIPTPVKMAPVSYDATGAQIYYEYELPALKVSKGSAVVKEMSAGTWQSGTNLTWNGTGWEVIDANWRLGE